MNKRPLALAAVLSTVIVAVAGCSPSGSNDDGDDTDAPTAFAAQFVNPLPSIPAWRTIGDCMADRFEELGVDFTESGSSGEGLDPTEMVTQLQQAIATGTDAVITFPVGDGFAPVLLQAQEAGIVTGVAYGTGGEGSGVDYVVGLDWFELGKLYGATIAEREGMQYVGLVADTDTGIGKEWMDGIREFASTSDHVEVVGAVFTNDDSSKALDQVNALLTANPEITVIATFLGTAIQGAVAAITNRDAVGEVFLVANGKDNGGREALESGIAYKILLTPFCDSGEMLAQTAFDWLNGDRSVDFVPVPSQMFGPDEVDEMIKQGWS